MFDFDGVFTNNKFSLNKEVKESVTLSRADGMAVKLLKEKNTMLVLSSEKNDIVNRCQKLGINYKNGIQHKIKYLKYYFSIN